MPCLLRQLTAICEITAKNPVAFVLFFLKCFVTKALRENNFKLSLQEEIKKDQYQASILLFTVRHISLVFESNLSCSFILSILSESHSVTFGTVYSVTRKRKTNQYYLISFFHGGLFHFYFFKNSVLFI